MRVALSRLVASGDVILAARGHYALAAERLEPFAHVRSFRTGFAARCAWTGGFVGVLTAELPRRNQALVRRRERALALAGLREFRHALAVRPDNLEGGVAAVAAHLARLGLDDEAEVIGVTLDARQVRAVEALYDVQADTASAVALESKVRALLGRIGTRSKRKDAAETFFVGDEVLRFLARDPLLPESMADPAPRRALATAMEILDERGHALWASLLDELEDAQRRTRWRRSGMSQPT
ncbi:MAG: hypothetical protein H5U40_18110 [Polyangiaceae bacterium]|nr:hypothetical protein [Polyangiaceae bacterium]